MPSDTEQALDETFSCTSIPNPTSIVADYYKGRAIFMTGASGFMGKVIVEKLLRSCSDVRIVYILLRPKKNLDFTARLQELLSSKVWGRIREESPLLLSKLVAMEGDITAPGLGLSDQDTAIIVQEVSVVFHVAATVRFNEPLRVAVSYNLEGTRRVADLARKIKKLEAFVHMSTAYSNCNRVDIGELVYPSPIKPEDMTSLLGWVDDDTLRIITRKLMKGHPNTYTFTKLLAENYLAEHCTDLPITIVRPAIVTAAWKEPFPGWIDNTYGPAGLFAAVRRGILRTTLIKRDMGVEVTPVDLAANLVLVAACYNNSNRRTAIESSWPEVLNFTSGTLNRLLLEVFHSNAVPRLMKPTTDLKHIRKPHYRPSLSPATYALRCLFQHSIPAAFADLFKMLRGQKPRMLGACSRLHGVLAEYMFFTLNEWNFHCEKAQKLLGRLSVGDQKIFGFNLKKLDWPSYMESYADGVCRFVLGEPAEPQNGHKIPDPNAAKTGCQPKKDTKNRNLKPSPVLIFGLTLVIVMLFRSSKVFKFVLSFLVRGFRSKC